MRARRERREPSAGTAPGAGVSAPSPSGDGVIAPAGSAFHAALVELAERARMVFFAGLPGTGKSLGIHQLAHLAHARGRRLFLLQWDVARPPFEAHPAGRAYPIDRGVTHGVIRLAVGRWARAAVARWSAEHADAAALLVGETPLVGNRLIELARPMPDAAEPLLAAPSARFVVPVPSAAVRAHIEAERVRRAAAPLHEREREDAPPEVMRDLWRQLRAAAVTLGVAPGPASAAASVPYDPEVYAAVYLAVLVRRHGMRLAMDAVLPASGLSPYDLRVPSRDLLPEPEDIARHIREAAASATDADQLRDRLERWYLTEEG